MKKLNVGSGRDVRKNWINLDRSEKNGADTIFDLNEILRGRKLPFEENTFDYILCSHVLEDFIEPVPIMDELLRICKKGGKIEIRVPFETNVWNWNPYHKRGFTLGMLKYYPEQSNYSEKKRIKVNELNYYCIMGGGKKINNLLKSIVECFYNLFPYKIVENTFIKYLFPIINCRVVYEKI